MQHSAALLIVLIATCCIIPTVICDFSDNIWVWGSNNGDELGLAAAGTRNVLNPTQAQTTLEQIKITQVAGSEDVMYFLRSDGQVLVSGNSNTGNLCLGAVTSVTKPTQITFPAGQTIVQISAGRFHVAFRAATGKIYVCGSNSQGQLGLGDRTQRNTPVEFTLGAATFIDVACGRDFTYVITSTNGVNGMGNNQFGQLGRAPTVGTSFITPQNVNTFPAGTVIAKTACGNFHAVFLSTTGAVFAVGFNNKGQLGLGDFTQRNTPVAITALNTKTITQIVAGALNTYFLEASTTTFWSVGDNAFGQLANGNNANSNTPVTQAKVANVVSIGSGDSFVHVIDNIGNVFAAGLNANGELGLGDTSNRSEFEPISATKLPCKVAVSLLASSCTSSSAAAILQTTNAKPALAIQLDRQLQFNKVNEIPHTFTPALSATSHVATIRYQLSGPATVTSTKEVWTPCTTPVVKTTCTGIGPIEFNVTSTDVTPALTTVKGYCLGLLKAEVASNTMPRGGAISVTITLSPAAPRALTLSLSASDKGIAGPSHTTLKVSPGQTKVGFSVVAPPKGRVGTSTIFAKIVENNFYFDTKADVSVFGTMTVKKPDCFSTGEPSKFVVTLDPPAPGKQIIFADSSVTEVPNGQSVIDVTITGGPPAALSTIVFTSAFYATASTQLPILRSVSSNYNGSFVAGSRQEFTLTVKPATSEDTTITLTGSNVSPSPSSVVIPKGASTAKFLATGTFAGPASLTFTATGYCTHKDTATITNGVTCTAAGTKVDSTGNTCRTCPGGANNICNLRGTCGFSRCFNDTVTCTCAGAFVGHACQFNGNDANPSPPFTQVKHTTATQDISVSTIPSVVGSATFTVPPNLSGNGPDTTFIVPYLASAPFFGAVSPATNVPQFGKTLPVGFLFEEVCADNALFTKQFNPAVTVTFVVDRATVSDFDFELTKLFKANSSGGWLDAQLDCAAADRVFTRDLASRTITTKICAQGQYNLFAVIETPIQAPLTGAHTIDSTTGITGLQPQEPPLPRFTPANGQKGGSPKVNLKPYLDSNSSTTLLPSLFFFFTISFISAIFFI